MENWDKWFYDWYKQYRESTDIESWLEAIWKMKKTLFKEELKENIQLNILLVFFYLNPQRFDYDNLYGKHFKAFNSCNWFFDIDADDLDSDLFFYDIFFMEYRYMNCSNIKCRGTNYLDCTEKILWEYLRIAKQLNQNNQDSKYEKKNSNLIKGRTEDDLFFVLSLSIATTPIWGKAYNTIIEKFKNGSMKYYKKHADRSRENLEIIHKFKIPINRL